MNKVLKFRKGFTMIEVVFVIVIIGILSGIAIPKFMGTRVDAMLAEGKSVVYSVRSALSAEKQNRFMNGDSTAITDLSSVSGYVFNKFSADKDGVQNSVFEYPQKSCTDAGCWSGSGTTYKYYLPEGGTCTYTISNGLFIGTCPKLGD